METDAEAGDKSKRKLSLCPFCQYSGSNDQSYLNHIVCMHYNSSYGCGKCVNEVFPSGQWLKVHMKHCKGLKVEAAKVKPATSHTKEASSSSSSSKKKKYQTKSQQSDSQPDSQTLLSTSSKASSCMSLHHSRCDKKKTAAATSKKSHSGGKDSGEKHSLGATSTPRRSTRHTSLTNT